MMACVAHESVERDRDHSSILGSLRGRRHFNENTIKLNFLHLNNPLGGYGYYYQASLRNLGLINQEPSRHVVTSLGEKVALAFEDCVRNTEFFSKFLDATKVPTAALVDYGKRGCLCMLPESTSPDRDILREVLLGINPRNEFDLKRRETLLLILNCVNLCSKLRLDLDNLAFLDSAYYHQILTDGEIIQLEFPVLFDDVLQKWRMFRAHDYFAYACESYLSSFLRMLDVHERTGLSLDGFLSLIDDEQTIEILSKILGTRFHVTTPNEIMIQDVLSALASRIMKRSMNNFLVQDSAIFDSVCTLSSEINERKIFDQLRKIFAQPQQFNLSEVSVLALALLLTLYARLLHLQKSANRYWRWMGGHSVGRATDLSPYKFVSQAEQKLIQDDLSIFEFLRWFIENYIIKQHQEVRNEKMQGMTVARPVSWFHRDGEVFRLDRMHKPAVRSSRFESCFHILKDLGYCKFNGQYTELTTDGKALLEKIRREGDVKWL